MKCSALVAALIGAALLAASCASSSVTVESVTPPQADLPSIEATGRAPATGLAAADPVTESTYAWLLEIVTRNDAGPGSVATFVTGRVIGNDGHVAVDASELIDATELRDVYLDLPDPLPPLETFVRDGQPYAVRGVTRVWYPGVFDLDPAEWYPAGPLSDERVDDDVFSPFLAESMALGSDAVRSELRIEGDGEALGTAVVAGVDVDEVRYLLDPDGIDRSAGPLAQLLVGDLAGDGPTLLTLRVDATGVVRQLEAVVPGAPAAEDRTTVVITLQSSGDPVELEEPDPLAPLPGSTAPEPPAFTPLRTVAAESSTLEYELGAVVIRTEGSPFSVIVRVAEHEPSASRRVVFEYGLARAALARSLSGYGDEYVDPSDLPGVIESVYVGDRVATLGLTVPLLGPELPAGTRADAIDPGAWYEYDLFDGEFLSAVSATPLFAGTDAVAALVGDRTSLVEVGAEELDGVELVEWTVAVDPDRIAAGDGLDGLLVPFEGYRYPRADGRLWSDASGTVRRIEVRWFADDRDTEPAEITELRLIAAGEPVTVELPVDVRPLP